MRNAKRAILLVLCAMMLVIASVMGTLAYLKSTDTVTNTFTVGDVEITLDETAVNEYGVAVAGAARVKTNEYKLISGHTYIKDPTVTVAKGSEPAYVRMLVTITDIKDLKAACGVAAENPFLPEVFVDGWDSTTWVSTKEIDYDSTTDTAVYEFRYKEIVDARNGAVVLDALFDEFTMPDTATNAQLADLVDTYDTDGTTLIDEGLKITVEAQAIQADGFEADGTSTAEAKAWAAFEAEVNG